MTATIDISFKNALPNLGLAYPHYPVPRDSGGQIIRGWKSTHDTKASWGPGYLGPSLPSVQPAIALLLARES